MLKSVGLTLAAIVALLATGSAPATAFPVPLPPLPYAYNALEPVITQKALTVHHTKHHQVRQQVDISDPPQDSSLRQRTR